MACKTHPLFIPRKKSSWLLSRRTTLAQRPRNSDFFPLTCELKTQNVTTNFCSFCTSVHPAYVRLFHAESDKRCNERLTEVAIGTYSESQARSPDQQAGHPSLPDSESVTAH